MHTQFLTENLKERNVLDSVEKKGEKILLKWVIMHADINIRVPQKEDVFPTR